jgi:hypothetical protein
MAAKKRKTEEAKPSQYVKFREAGESVSGKFGGFVQGSWEGRATYGMRIGGKILGLGVVLADYVKSNEKLFTKPGCQVVVNYLGTSGRTHLYSMIVNGKEIQRASSFAPKGSP